MGRGVFVSYARTDLAVAIELAKDLAVVGHDVWFDQDLEGGQDWWAEILRRIESCDVFVAVLSEESLASIACRREYEFAVQLRRAILPVRVDDLGSDALISADLSRRHHIEYRANDKHATLRLLTALESLPPSGAPPTLVITPEAPMSELELVGGEIAGDAPLDESAQLVLLARLTAAARDPRKRDVVARLVDSLRARRDTLASVDRELGALADGLALPIRSPRTPQFGWSPQGPPRVTMISRDRRSIRLSVKEGEDTWLLNASAKAFRFGGNARLEVNGIAVPSKNLAVKMTGDVIEFAPLLSNGRQLDITVRASDLGGLTWIEVKSEGQLLFSNGV